ncbi:MAG: hypothetical protein JNM65_15055 [Verrucomicrobiaceae bacterium]|nr:hypothetical protein [Verrucomicrobiaceae bacterium]
MTKEIRSPKSESVPQTRGVTLLRHWVVAVLLWFVASSVLAEIRETVLDWEPACDGSSIKVTSQDGKLALIEASAWHFAEARDWILVFKDGTLLSASYRHYTLNRKEKGDSGEFEIQSTLDQVKIFQAERGGVQKIPAELKTDLETILSKARTSLAEPSKPK